MALNTPINTDTSGYSRKWRRVVKRGGSAPPPPPETFRLTTRTGDLLTTRTGDYLTYR